MGHKFINLSRLYLVPNAENIYTTCSIFFFISTSQFYLNRYNNNICLPHDKRINGADWTP